jgi:hypothetical protein
MARELLVIAKRINLTTGKAIGRHDLELAAAKYSSSEVH